MRRSHCGLILRRPAGVSLKDERSARGPRFLQHDSTALPALADSLGHAMVKEVVTDG
jgi:hypothetical protein